MGSRRATPGSVALVGVALAGLALLLSTAVGCGPDTPEGTTRDVRQEGRAGLIVVEGTEVFRDGEWKKQGRFVFRDGRGEVIAEGAYEDGLETGPWVQTLDDGARGEGSFENGSRTGEWHYYHRNGQLQDVGSYDRGRRTGLWQSFRDDGTRLREAEYESGKMHGSVTYFGPDGTSVDAERSGRYVRGEKRDPAR